MGVGVRPGRAEVLRGWSVLVFSPRALSRRPVPDGGNTERMVSHSRFPKKEPEA